MGDVQFVFALSYKAKVPVSVVYAILHSKDMADQSSLSLSSFQPVTAYERVNELLEPKQGHALGKQSLLAKEAQLDGWIVTVRMKRDGNRLSRVTNGSIDASAHLLHILEETKTLNPDTSSLQRLGAI